MPKKKNATETARVFYGLHMSEGVAQYENGNQPERIFIGTEAINRMNKTFPGKPVYVEHQDQPLELIEDNADGYVIESFFNKADGKFWAKFIVTTDDGISAIRRGCALSNCYDITSTSPGGRWHNVDYTQEVMDGVFDHLAIVDNPRYEESVIFTPDEFREYNAKKEAEMSALVYNSKEKKMPFSLFKKTKVENADEIIDSCVQLENGEEISVKDMIEKVVNSSKKKKKNEVDPEQTVQVGDQTMTVAQLIAAYEALKAKDAPADNAENAADDGKDKTKNETEEEKEARLKKERDKKENAGRLANAGPPSNPEPIILDTNMDRIDRGRARYGSAVK